MANFTEKIGNHRRDAKNGRFVDIHGLGNHKLYNVWCSMKERCANKHNKSYKNYGERGIKVCDEWRNDFKAFYNWAMANGYTDGLTIDRIDNNGNYEPSNCRWASRRLQNRNYGRNHLITFNGETLCLCDMAGKYNIPRARLTYRLSHGWDIEKALLTKGDGRALRYAK